jgi:hypothetical protein
VFPPVVQEVRSKCSYFARLLFKPLSFTEVGKGYELI